MKPREVEDAEQVFKKHFGYKPPYVVSAPGRLDLLGADTAHHEGVVMCVAVNRFVHVACGPRTDGRIELISSAFPGRDFFWMSEVRRNPSTVWADCVKGVLAQLRRRGVAFSGFNAAIHSTIPTGFGMGNSTALAVATALAVRQLYPFALTETGATVPPRRNERGALPPLNGAEKMHLARLCREAELDFLGRKCSLADHVAVLCGKAWQVMSVDCRFGSVTHERLVGEALIVCDAGIQPVQRDESENRPGLGASAAQKLQAKTLRSVEPKLLRTRRERLTPEEFALATHVTGEMARAVAAERALRDEDHRQFGQYLSQSHESARDNMGNSSPEADWLVDMAKKHPGCLGARSIGRGRATVNLVAYHQAESFMDVLGRLQAKRPHPTAVPMGCQIVDGAG